MVRDYKKYICLNEACNYEWIGYQKRPRCPKCHKYIIQVLEPKNKKQEENEVIEFKEENKETEISFEALNLSVEDETKEETIKYRCGDCGAQEIEFGDLYCPNCGERLDVNWEELKR